MDKTLLIAAFTTTKMVVRGETNIKYMDEANCVNLMKSFCKSLYSKLFSWVVKFLNLSLMPEADKVAGTDPGDKYHKIGLLDIFGFETFEVNNFEQICINYTNEALQQQFNKYVFKLEQDEYEREGILWKFISFPDNQDVLDLIDRKHMGILALLDGQCIVPRSNDQHFT